MKGEETKSMSLRLKFKLATVLFLGVAAFMVTVGQPASASSACPGRHCQADATILGCCNGLTAYGTDSRGPCSVHAIWCLRKGA